MNDLAARLRALPAFPAELPVLDPATVPGDPTELFLDWLDESISSGARQPHAMTFTSLDEDGYPVGRTLIIKDVDEHGYHFSTHRSSRKGIQLEEDPRGSMVFFWRESGRQVRVTGTVVALDEEASRLDWEQRPSYTGAPNPDWQRYALVPSEVEFMQAREDRHHTRLEYRRTADAWVHGLVESPAG